MNREQAEHLLDAYAKAKVKDAKDALREVILDAMTTVRYYPYRYYPYYPTVTWGDGAYGTSITWTGTGTDGATTISSNGMPGGTTAHINGIDE